MKKVVFLLLWKHEKFQLLRLWGRKSFDFQTLVAEKFQFHVEIYTPEYKDFVFTARRRAAARQQQFNEMEARLQRMDANLSQI